LVSPSQFLKPVMVGFNPTTSCDLGH